MAFQPKMCNLNPTVKIRKTHIEENSIKLLACILLKCQYLKRQEKA